MEFKLPEIGEGVHEGEIVKWLVKAGDSIAVDQPVVEVMTDKATVEIPSPNAGKVVQLHSKEGDIIKVGQTIMTLDAESSASASAPAKTASAPKPAAPNAPISAPAPQRMATPATSSSSGGFQASPGNVLATPGTRRLATDLSLDLTQVPASGPKGRVTKEDVLNFAGATAAGRPSPTRILTGMPQAPMNVPTVQRRNIVQPGTPETLIPFRGIRRKISEAMVKSRTTIPDFTYVDECDVTELVEFRKEAKAMAEKQGVKLTYMPFICKAAIQGLKAFPQMNATLDEAAGNIIVKNYYNIGMAVDTEDGLVVPVVKNADQKSILEIAAEMQELAEKARTRKLALEDMQGGSFTITNAGNIGGMLATPIINHPEVAIMGVHKISKRPVVKNDQIAIADVIWLSIAVDHRVVDGAMAARFMNVAMEYLSSPKKLMLEMA
ncbi:MAG: dihydrolipoamide acetyltransferase family protein [Bacteriovoracia bacterium]